MKCFVRRGMHHAVIKCGWGNGYVVIPPNHPCHGKDYDDIPVSVHGGLTYSVSISAENLSFDPCLDNSDIGSWLVGFDTAHAGDNPEEHWRDYVERQTLDLVKQLEQIASSAKDSIDN